MVWLDDLAALFHLAVREDAMAGGVTIGYKGRTVILTAGQALASAGGRLVSLPAPPVRDGRRWLVPVEFVNRALGPVYDARLDVRKNSRLVLVGDVRVPRVAVRQEPSGAQTRVIFPISPRAPYTISQEQGRVLVRVDADALDVTLPAFAPLPLLQSIHLVGVRTDDCARRRPALRVVPRVARGRRTMAAYRCIVDMLPAAAEQAPPAPPRGGLPPLPVPPPPDVQPPAAQPTAGALRTVVIDAGPRRRRQRRAGRHRRPGEGRHAGAGEAAEERAREPARRARAPHPRRRPDGRARRPGGAREQQQGRPVRQPPRKRVRARGRSAAPRSTSSPPTTPPMTFGRPCCRRRPCPRSEGARA